MTSTTGSFLAATEPDVERRTQLTATPLACSGAGERPALCYSQVGPHWAVVAALLLRPDVCCCHPHSGGGAAVWPTAAGATARIRPLLPLAAFCCRRACCCRASSGIPCCTSCYPCCASCCCPRCPCWLAGWRAAHAEATRKDEVNPAAPVVHPACQWWAEEQQL